MTKYRPQRAALKSASTRLIGDRFNPWIVEESDAAVASGPQLPGKSAVTGGRATGASDPWVVVVIVCVAQFMVVLDATIVTTRHPS
jgi:hypothetical protein